MAAKYKLPISTVEAAVKSQFEFVAKVISEGNRETEDFKTVMLPNFGKFAPVLSMIKYINANKEKAKKTEDESNNNREECTNSLPIRTDDSGV